MLLNNVCESFNKYIIDTRDKPIIILLETIRRLLMQRFQSKRECLQKIMGSLCPKIQKKLEKVKLEALDYHYIWGRGHRFEVEHHNNKFVVALEDSICGCRV